MKTALRIATLSILLGTMLACSSDEDAIVVSPIPAFTPTLQPKEVWSRDVNESLIESTSFSLGTAWRAIWPWASPAGNDRPLNIQNPADLTPVIYNDKIYIGNGEGLMSCYDKDGKEIWRDWIGAKMSGGFAAGANIVAFGTIKGEVIALNAETGEEKWRNLVSSEVISAPAIAEGKVVVRTIDGRIFALNVDNGERLWQADKNIPLLTQRGTSSPIITGGIVIAGFDNGKVSAFRGDNGTPLWEKRVGQPTGRSEIERIVDVDSDPVVFGTILYAASYNGSVLAIDLRNGETQWQRELSTYQNIAVDFQHIALSAAKGHVVLLDRQSGYVVWNQKLLENRQLSAPVLLGDYVVVADFEGQVYWLKRSDGEFVARTALSGSSIGDKAQVIHGSRTVKNVKTSGGAALQAPPVVFEQKVLFYDRENTLTLMTLP